MAWPDSTPSMLHRHISSRRTSLFGQEMHCGKVKLLQLRRRHKIKGMSVLLLCNLRSKGNRRGSQVIVIHPGSRFIRIGKASDVNPVSVPCVVARKHKTPFVATERVSLVSRPRPGASADKNLNEDTPPDDPVSFTEDKYYYSQ